MTRSVRDAFDLSGRVALITGGAGLLGVKHAEAIAEMGGIPWLLDLDGDRAGERAAEIARHYGVPARGLACDVTVPEEIAAAVGEILEHSRCLDILINNAANNPKIEDGPPVQVHWSRLEVFPIALWQRDIDVGLTGAFLCSRIAGSEMAKRGRGVILNVASDLALIAPDQRIYRTSGVPDEQQLVKPVSYSVVKAGLLGLTRYLATYWAERGVRVNSISPGGVRTTQPTDFVARLSSLIPVGRMAEPDEYKAAVLFLVSDASSYVTGTNLVVDGGRTCW